MSTGSAPTPLLKAAPEPAQLAERLAGGPWGGLELCLRPQDVRDDAAVAAAAGAVLSARVPGALLAEAPVAWPSGAFVRVDEPSAEALSGLERSAEFAAAIGSPVLTVHLFAPQTPAERRAGRPLDAVATQRFLEHFARVCDQRGVRPLLENVPPVLRMRTGGVYLTPVGGHWADLLGWRERVPALGFTLDTSHAALFRAFCAACPRVFGLTSDEDLELDRYVAELGPWTAVAHVSNAVGILGEGLPYDAGELDLDPVVARLAIHADHLVAEINEPDPARSPVMKAGHRAIERALAAAPAPWRRPPRRLPGDPFDWQAVLEQRDPLPAVLELAERLEGRRVLITGGGGTIGRRLASLLDAFRPERTVLLDLHEGSLAADRRARDPGALARMDHVLADARDRGRLEEEMARVAPDVVFHLAAYKHVDWAERFPEEFAATNLDGSWNVLRAAGRAGARTVVVASTDKAALASGRYGRSKRLMEALAALAAERTGGERSAVRLVNVLGSAGSASELFLRQARADVPLSVTDGGMQRFWMTQEHAATLVAHGALEAGAGGRLATVAQPVALSVGALAGRIWTATGRTGPPAIALLGVRPGETMAEVLLAPGEALGPERFAGCAEILGEPAADTVRALVERVDDERDPAARRAHWAQALAAPVAASA